jgi:hypothetical protein
MQIDENRLPNEFVLNELENYIRANPRNTYFGIGSAPHNEELISREIKWDQIMPVFLLDELQRNNDPWRIIHFDPHYEKKIGFLKVYFKRFNLTYDNSEGYHMWRSEDHRIEVLIFDRYFHHQNPHQTEDDDWFLQKLNESILVSNTKLIVQEYTGHDLRDICMNLFRLSSNPEKFKKKILYDVTHGEDCHCGTDLTKYKPFYDKDGNFINIALFNETDLLNVYGTRAEINDIVKKHFIKKLKLIVNNDHVNYRRSLLNIGGNLFRTHRYDDDSTPDQIMKSLQDQIMEIISIFKMLKLMTPNKERVLEIIMKRYREIDPYKWQSHFNLIFSEEDITEKQIDAITFDYVVPKVVNC